MRPPGSVGSFSGTTTLSATGPTGTAAASLGATGIGGTTGTGTGDPSMQQMMSQDADQNLYYLQLQEQMSQEAAAILRFRTC